MSAITVTQARADAAAAGFTGDAITIIVAICMAESGLDPAKAHVNVDGSIDRGIAEINNAAWPDISDTCAYDEVCAFQKAYYPISQRGTNFNAWVTYQTGAYRQFLQDASGTGPSSSVQSLLASFYDPTHISQSFGVPEMGNSAYGMHTGVDYEWPTGTQIPALAGGTVERVTTGCPGGSAVPGDPNAQCGSGYGNHPEIRLPDGRLTIYGHMQNVLVNQGDTVQPGQIIGTVDTTGFSSGPHTHVELRDANGTPVDPSSFIANAISAANSAPGTLPTSNTPTGGGNLGNFWEAITLGSLSRNVSKQISHIQGFDGIVLAVDQAEQTVGMVWSNPIGSVLANASAIATRFLIVFVGIIVFIYAMLSLVNSPGISGIPMPSPATEAESGLGEGLTLPTEALAL